MRSIFVLFILLFSIRLSAQIFGGNPFSMKWQSVGNDTVAVVFPQGYDIEREVEQLVFMLTKIQKEHSSTIGSKIKKIHIVLQANSLISNGFVQLAPWKSEFYLNPLQDAFQLGAEKWMNYLGTHEFRHVEQYSNYKVGVSKLGYILLGEQGQSLANAMSVPDWFFEGDAVYNETYLSAQGRGRLPLFMNQFRILDDSHIHYRYMTYRNGSLRKYIPNQYPLGYLLVNYGREHYDSIMWRNVSIHAAAFRPLFYPLQGALKKYTHQSFRSFVSDAFNYYQQQWRLDTTHTTLKWITPIEKNNVVDYRYPYIYDSNTVVVLKKSYKTIPSFYLVHSNGKEEKITTKGISLDDYFSYKNHRIIYASYKPNIRWGYLDNNQLAVVDMATKKTKLLYAKNRYFSPDISTDGKQILVVEVHPNFSSDIVWIRGSQKKVYQQQHIFFSYPKFSKDENHFFVVARNIKGWMAIGKGALPFTDSIEWVIPFSNRIIGFPVVQGDTISFSVTNNGRDEWWAYIDNTASLYQLATYPTGIYQGVIMPHQEGMVSIFTSYGYRLAWIQEHGTLANFQKSLYPLFAYQSFTHADTSFVTQSFSDSSYAIKRYPKFAHPFNFHSWQSLYMYPNYTFTVLGNNLLNTFQHAVTYQYNTSERSHQVGYSGSYGGFFVQPIYGTSFTFQRSVFANIQGYNTPVQINWNQWNSYIGAQVPFNFTLGKLYHYFTPAFIINNQQNFIYGIGRKYFLDNNITYSQLIFQYNTQIQQAIQQIYPHFSFSFLLNYQNTFPTSTVQQVQQVNISSSLFLRGIGTNHAIQLDWAYMKASTATPTIFGSSFPMSRGYAAIYLPQLMKVGFNYHVPLAYPDWGFANIVYFLRIRANIFFDYTWAPNESNLYFPSAGIELYADTKIWNQYAITIGMRYSRILPNNYGNIYSLSGNENVFEVIFPFSILQTNTTIKNANLF